MPRRTCKYFATFVFERRVGDFGEDSALLVRQREISRDRVRADADGALKSSCSRVLERPAFQGTRDRIALYVGGCAGRSDFQHLSVAWMLQCRVPPVKIGQQVEDRRHLWRVVRSVEPEHRTQVIVTDTETGNTA